MGEMLLEEDGRLVPPPPLLPPRRAVLAAVLVVAGLAAAVFVLEDRLAAGLAATALVATVWAVTVTGALAAVAA